MHSAINTSQAAIYPDTKAWGKMNVVGKDARKTNRPKIKEFEG